MRNVLCCALGSLLRGLGVFLGNFPFSPVRFAANCNGNVAVVAGLLIIPVILAAGVAVEYSQVRQTKTKLQIAADSAVLAGISAAETAIKQNGKLANIKIEDIIKTTTEKFMAANVEPSVSQHKPNVSVTSSYAKNGINNTVTVDIELPTSFMRLAGFESFPVSISANAETGRAEYKEVTILVDVSNSMGVVSSLAEYKKVENGFAGKKGCAFSCHTDIAVWKKNGFQTKLDLVQNSLIKGIDFLANSPAVSNVRFGLSTFSSTFKSHFDTRHPRAGDPSWVKQRINSQLKLNTGWKGSRYEMAVDSLANHVAPSGSGKNPNDPKQVVLIITDGAPQVNDAFPEYNTTVRRKHHLHNHHPKFRGHHYPVIANTCKKLKKTGAQVYVVFSGYFLDFKAPRPDQRGTRDALKNWLLEYNLGKLRECASAPQNFFRSTDKANADVKIAEVMHAITSDMKLHLSR